MSFFSVFRYAIFLSLFFILGAVLYTLFFFGVSALLPFLFLLFILIVLEISLSFDNAIINASILQKMPPFWQKVYLFVGIFFSVFVIRFFLPLLIFSLFSNFSLAEAFRIAYENPKLYAHALHQAHPQIATFGGIFLGLMGLHFFINTQKDTHWLTFLEAPLAKIGSFIVFPPLFIGGIYFLSSQALPEAVRYQTLLPALFGFGIFYLLKLLSKSLPKISNNGFHSGLVSLLYLEVIDASFSIDSVVGAITIVQDIFIILCGLGIGAIFVRSITLYITRKGFLKTYIYLEHGAFWAISFLALTMFLSFLFPVPKWLTVSGFLLIFLAFRASIKEKSPS